MATAYMYLALLRNVLLTVLIVLQEAGLCLRTAGCPKCHHAMKIVYNRGHFLFRCQRGTGAHCCTGQGSLYATTFLEGVKLEPKVILGILYHLSFWREYLQASIAVQVRPID